MDVVQQWFRALSEREQRIVLIGAAATLCLLLLALLLPLERRTSSAQARVATKSADLAWMRSMAPQLATLRTQAPRGTGESLVVLADRAARSAGIARSLSGSQPAGDGTLSVRFDAVGFDGLAGWAGALTQQYGVRVVSANVDAASAAGMVSATIVLRAP